MKKIQIQETKKADARTLKPGDISSEKDVKRDAELHIEAVGLRGDFLCDKIKKQFKERRHLNDKVPEDVNLIDVLEMICDRVCAGMARTGAVYDVALSNETLKKSV